VSNNLNNCQICHLIIAHIHIHILILFQQPRAHTKSAKYRYETRCYFNSRSKADIFRKTVANAGPAEANERSATVAWRVQCCLRRTHNKVFLLAAFCICINDDLIPAFRHAYMQRYSLYTGKLFHTHTHAHAHGPRAYSKRVPRTNCALRIKKCAPRISTGIYFLSTS